MASVRSLAGCDRAPHVGLEGMRGQRQEPRLLLGEDLRDRLIARLGMRAPVRDLVAPAPKLRIQIVDIGEGPRARTISKSRVARSRGYCASVSRINGK